MANIAKMHPESSRRESGVPLRTAYVRGAAPANLLCARPTEVHVPTETHPLESFFQEAVRTNFVEKIGLNDNEIIDYVAHVLCEFSPPGPLFRLKDANGHRVETMAEMLHAADPVYGTAASFDEERSVRRYIGDYAMFVAGMQLDVMESAPNYQADRAAVDEFIRIGRESYFIVSQFDLFEYEKDAPVFARLAGHFDRCVLGLALVRDELNDRRSPGAIQL